MPANSDNANDYPLTSPGVVPSPAIGYWLLAIDMIGTLSLAFCCSRFWLQELWKRDAG